MIHSTKDAGPELRLALYNEAIKIARQSRGYQEGGWDLIRGLGKKILKNQQASDSECAEAIIMQGK